MKDLARAVALVEDLDKALNESHDGKSDLYFDLQDVQIPVRIDGVATEWSIRYSWTMDAWVVQFGDDEEDE